MMMMVGKNDACDTSCNDDNEDGDINDSDDDDDYNDDNDDEDCDVGRNGESNINRDFQDIALEAKHSVRWST